MISTKTEENTIYKISTDIRYEIYVNQNTVDAAILFTATLRQCSILPSEHLMPSCLRAWEKIISSYITL